jgi:hypothetical protein
MEKYLSVPVTGEGSQLVSISGVKLIDSASATATATTIAYIDGTVSTITHAAAVAFDVRIALEVAMDMALQTSWTKVAHTVVMPKAVSAIANA